MFSDEIWEKVFSHKDTRKIEIGKQTTIIRVIEEILEQAGYDFRDVTFDKEE